MSAVEDNSASGAEATTECPFCAERILARAKKCRFCGETIDVALRKAEEALRAGERSNGNVYMNAAAAAPVVTADAYPRSPKSRGLAVVLALLLGGLGAHKFYLGRVGWGIIYLLFCWTFIPAIIAFVEAIMYALMGENDFHRKYG